MAQLFVDCAAAVLQRGAEAVADGHTTEARGTVSRNEGGRGAVDMGS